MMRMREHIKWLDKAYTVNLTELFQVKCQGNRITAQIDYLICTGCVDRFFYLNQCA